VVRKGDLMDYRKIHEELTDNKKTFIEILTQAAGFNLDYWNNREKRPNETVGKFKSLIKFAPKNIKPKWNKRISLKGHYGKIGENTCFEFFFNIQLKRKKQRYKCKGYFFDKDYRRGVVIQTFRVETLIKIIK